MINLVLNFINKAEELKEQGTFSYIAIIGQKLSIINKKGNIVYSCLIINWNKACKEFGFSRYIIDCPNLIHNPILELNEKEVLSLIPSVKEAAKAKKEASRKLINFGLDRQFPNLAQYEILPEPVTLSF